MTYLRIALAALVIAVWLTGYILAYSSGGDRPEELTVLMGLVVGWALGGEVKDAVKRRLTPNGDDDAPQD